MNNADVMPVNRGPPLSQNSIMVRMPCRAAAEYRRQRRTRPRPSHRQAGVTITRASQPDPGRAARLGMDALAIARDTGSARITRELRTLDSQLLSRWPGHPATRDFTQALATA